MKRYIVNKYTDYFNYIRKKLIYCALQWAFNELKVDPLNLKALKVLEKGLFNFNDVIDNIMLTAILDKLIHIITVVSLYHNEPDDDINNAIIYIISLYEKKKFLPTLTIDMYIIDTSYIINFDISDISSSSKYSLRINNNSMIRIMNNIKMNKLTIKHSGMIDINIQNRILSIGNSYKYIDSRKLRKLYI
jgi:hypothetical protein